MNTLTFGKYIVRVGLRCDNPAFPVYLVYVGNRLIGKSFSVPDEGCCRWLERQDGYAQASAKLKTPRDYQLKPDKTEKPGWINRGWSKRTA
jgi:hypothetical protein